MYQSTKWHITSQAIDYAGLFGILPERASPLFSGSARLHAMYVPAAMLARLARGAERSDSDSARTVEFFTMRATIKAASEGCEGRPLIGAHAARERPERGVA
jgi:hypothetical protein